METQKAKGDDIGQIIMEAEKGRTGKAEKRIKEYIEAMMPFEAQSLAQAIGRELTADEWKRVEKVCRQKAEEGDENATEVAEVALIKAEKAEIND
jgi:hypothetical protein